MLPIQFSFQGLFQQHSNQTIRTRIEGLHYFCFTRTRGRHAGIKNSFTADFGYGNRQDLLHKIKQLGITLQTIPVVFPKPITADNYIPGECRENKSEIRRFKYYEQPGHTQLFGQPAFVWITDNSITISVSGSRNGNYCAVTADDLVVCLAIEKELLQLNWESLPEQNMSSDARGTAMATHPELRLHAAINGSHPNNSSNQ